MSTSNRNTLKELLIENNLVPEDILNRAFDENKKTRTPLLEILGKNEAINTQELYEQLKTLLELQYGTNFLELNSIETDLELLSIFPREILLNHKFLPVKKLDNTIVFALVDPDNILAEREIKYRLRDLKDIKIKKTVILEDDFNNFTEKHFPKDEKLEVSIEQDTDELLSSMGVDILESAFDALDVADLTDSAQEAPIIQLANGILGTAIKRGVSDIHVEPGEKELQVRFRQDGVLSIYKTIPKKIQNALISRYKIMAELDISERRLPQDGRIRVKMANKVIDFRVSSLPSKFGEKIVMRILDKSNISLGLDNLITNKEILKTVREMISRPYGIIFVTGPTGSGKTTTLYSALSERNTPEVNISTAEDPIEYDLNGITQSEVHKSIGMDFAKILKAFLRQDPDIMLVGETRDKETAKIAIEAALTGHLVFTTLHTNDAPSSITRLMEMEIEPFLISSSIIGVVAQRLLRRICPNCKEEFAPAEEVLKFLQIEKHNTKIYYRGKGCEKCNNTGYKGRVGAYEVMKVNDHIRSLIAKGENSSIVRLAAQEAGMKTLLEYSLELAREGHTTLDEVIRVTFTSEGSSSLCKNCGKPVDDDFYKCPFCQTDLKQTCPRCSALIQEGWNSCAKCGLKLLDHHADTTCGSCGGEISLDMNECPWCYNMLDLKKSN